MACAAVASTLWGMAFMSAGASSTAIAWLSASFLDVVRYGFWFAFLLTLLGLGHLIPPSRTSQTSWIKYICLAIVAAGIALPLGAIFGVISPQEWLNFTVIHGLSEAIVGLLLVEQLYRTVAEDSRWNVKPICLALLFQFGFDLFLFADALMFGRFDADAFAVRGFVHTLTVPLLMLSSERNRNWTTRIRLSQRAAFHSATLLASGLYLLFTAGIGYYVRFTGGEWGRALQFALLIAASLLLALMLFSGSLRAKIRVLVGKHFFTYRYDYREEWLRFTNTLNPQGLPSDMGQQVIRGLSDMVESPAGILWQRDQSGLTYRQSARWNLPEIASSESADSPFISFLVESGWVINLEEYRCYPGRYSGLDIPQWLSEMPNAWLIIPLTVSNELLGFVVLASARTPISVDWEVNDLLRTAGCQAASFLAKIQATEALLESRKFDAFNKMSAFVVHDLKNIITQLSLMLKNAEKHSQNPEFQQDMLSTVDHAVERMRQLMLQLREGAAPPGGVCGVNLVSLIEKVQREKSSQGRQIDTVIEANLFARGHEERLERVVGHVVQNGLDASPVDSVLVITVRQVNDKAAIAVVDRGHGMSQEFIRDRLFKPFQSTKEMGMGIGAYESAQYIRELGGEIDVQSEQGHGSQITLLLPVFNIRNEPDLNQKVAA